MAWLLCDAAIRCQARRLGELASRAPLAVALIALAIVGGPIAALVASRSLADAFGSALAEPQVAQLLVVSLALLASAAGGSLGLSAGGIATLGQQIASAPLSRPTMALAMAVPLLLSAAALAPLAIAFLMPLAAASPGGWGGGVALCASLAAAGAVGALVAECVLGSVRRSRLHGAMTMVIAGGVAYAIQARLDPSAPLIRALTAGAGTPAALLESLALMLCAVIAWGVLRGRRPSPRPRSRLPLLPWRRMPLLSFGLAVIGRRSDIRPALGAAVVFAATASVVALIVDLGEIGSTGTGLAPALAAVVVAPLGVAGAIASAHWLLGTAPLRRGRLGGAMTLAPTLVVAGIVCVGIAAAIPSASPTSAGIGLAAAASALTVASGLIAGSVAPWRSTGFADQILSVVVLGGVGGGLAGATYGFSEFGSRIGLADGAATIALPLVALGFACVLIDLRVAG